MRIGALLTTTAVLITSCALPDVGAEGDPETEVVEPAADESTDEETEPAETAEADPEPEAEPEPDQEALEIVDYGFSTFTAYDDTTRASWAVVVDNPNDDLHVANRVNVTVTLTDTDGSVVHSDTDSISVLLPGQQAAVVGRTLDDVSEVADMRVQARARSWDEEPGPFGEFTPSDVSVTAQDRRGWRVSGHLASTFTRDFEDVYVKAVLRDEAGDIVGGEFTFVDFVPAGDDTSFQINVSADLDEVVSADVYAHLSSLSMF